MLDAYAARSTSAGDHAEPATLCALSWFFCENNDNAFVTPSVLSRALAIYAHTDLPGSPAPATFVPTVGIPAGETALRHLGMTRDEVLAVWRRALDADGLRARLPDSILAELFLLPFWVAAEMLIAEGPRAATERLERGFRLAAEVRVPCTRARPEGGTMSKTSLRAMYGTARGFMKRVCWLRSRGWPDGPLDAWIALPPQGPTGGVDANTDRSAPPRRLVRRAWQTRRDDVLTRLDTTEEDLVDCLASMSSRQIREARVFRALRALAILGCLVTFGPRGRALVRTRRLDLVEERALLDGRRQPALRLYPRKTMDPGEESWKPLPQGLWQILVALQMVVDAHAGSRLDVYAPLIPAQLATPEKHMERRALWRLVAGEPPSTLPFVPRDEAVFGTPKKDLTPKQFYGYSPHALRGAAAQLTMQGLEVFAPRLLVDATRDEVADVLLDHRIARDRLGYLQLNRAPVREHLSAVASEVIWRLVTTDEGAHRVPNVEALREALTRRTAIEAQLSETRRRIDEGHDRLRRMVVAPDGATHAGALLDGLRRQLELSTFAALDRRLSDELARTDVEIERLKLDQATWVALPDNRIEQDGGVDVDRLQSEIDGTRLVRGRRVRRVRDFITVAELAELAGVAPATARRWVNGQTLPHRPGDPRNPWERDAIPVDGPPGSRTRRIEVAGIKPTFFDTQWKRDRLEELLERPPRGAGRSEEVAAQ